MAAGVFIYVILDGVQCDLVSLQSHIQVYTPYSASAVFVTCSAGSFGPKYREFFVLRPHAFLGLRTTSKRSLDNIFGKYSLASNHTYLFYSVLFRVVHLRSTNAVAHSFVSVALLVDVGI